MTLAGSAINMGLVAFKFISGILGGSAAMIADAVHSLSDLLTDAIVLVFVHISEKPQDEDHDYGHGKYETMASSIIGIALLLVGAAICYDGVLRIASVINGETLPQPGLIALVAALVSITLKEWAYRFTVRVGRRVDSPAVVANAWHHRSDALSSIGTGVGIGGALVPGSPRVSRPHSRRGGEPAHNATGVEADKAVIRRTAREKPARGNRAQD